MTHEQDPAPSKASLAGAWLQERSLPAAILRGRASAESVLSHSMIGLMFFLAHWEEAYAVTGIGVWVFPFDRLPSAWQLWSWVPAVLSMPFNAWWLDRYVSRESGMDIFARKPVLWARRLLCALPIFGLFAIPCWRWLMDSRPRWAFRVEARADLVLAACTSPKRETPHRRDQPLFAPVIFFAFWCFLANFIWLRAAAVSLSTWNRPLLDRWILVTIVLLRWLGFVLTVVYVRRWCRRRGLGREWVILQLVGALSWLVPLPAFYFAAFLTTHFGERAWEGSLVGSSRRAGVDRKLRAVEKGAPMLWRWHLSHRVSAPESEIALQHRAWLRLEMASLFLEVPLVMVLFSRFQHVSLLLAAPLAIAFLCLVASGLLGLLLGLAGFVLAALCRELGELRSRWARFGMRQFFASLVVFAGIVVGASLIGEPVWAGFWLEQVGKFGALIGFLVGMPSLLGSLRGKPERRSSAFPWFWFYVFLWSAGVMLQRDPQRASIVYLVVFFLLYAFFRLRALRSLPWLLWPFRSQDVFRPALPWAVRCRLLWLLMLGVAPLTGSLAALAMTGRGQLETAFEQFWSETGTTARKFSAESRACH